MGGVTFEDVVLVQEKLGEEVREHHFSMVSASGSYVGV